MASCSVIVVNWNAATVIETCLASIARQRPPVDEVVVFDNASTDASVQVVERWRGRELPFALRLIRSAENLGFGRACNAAAAAAAGDRLVFLNPDTELAHEDAVARLGRALDDRGIGLVGPQLLNADGTIQQSPSSFPSVWRSLLMVPGLHLLLPDAARAALAPVAWSQTRSRDAHWLRGAALGMRREVFDAVGGFATTTFMYGEDLDLGYRVRRAGYRVRYCAEARVTHLDNHSADQRWSREQRVRRVAEGDLAFLARHCAAPRRTAIRALWTLGFAARAGVFRLLRRHEQAATYAVMTRVYAGLG